MMAEMLHHGPNGDAILGIIARAAVEPHDGKVFFARHRWESLFMHGADTKRNASFVVKVQGAWLPSGRNWPRPMPLCEAIWTT